MKKKYIRKAAAISRELHRVREMCDELEAEIEEDANEDLDDSDRVNFDDGCVFLDDACSCFIGFEPEKKEKKR